MATPTKAAQEKEAKLQSAYSKAQAERLIKIIDSSASRYLNGLAKTDDHQKWKFSDSDVAELMEWLPDAVQRYDITIDNPLVGFLISLSLILNAKRKQALEVQQLQKSFKKASKTKSGKK